MAGRNLNMHEALFYERLGGDVVRCGLCERRCNIPDGGRGVCGVRENRGGILYSLVYGRPVSVAVDPIEKKPLYHFMPGSSVFSVATVGCNFKCLHCQNWEISQARPEDFPVPYVSPKRLVGEAVESGAQGLAYTYVEPTVFYEFARDMGVIGRDAGLYNVFVTNGYFTEDVLKDLAGWADALNVDLKGDERFYREVAGGVSPKIVRRNILLAYRSGLHVEVTVLVVPGWNDSEEWFREEVVEFLADIDPSIPLHISRFYPHYRMKNVPPTPIPTLEKLYELAMEELHYVYLGNVGDPRYETTYCPSCGYPVIRRVGYAVENELRDGRCPNCGREIEGVWSIKNQN